jgi:uncharacterized protein YkwD
MDTSAFEGPQNMFTTRLTSSRCTGSALALVLLAACGGGGDSPPPPSSALSGTPAVTPSPTPSPTPSAPAPAPAAAADCGLSDFAVSVLARVNQIRAAGASCGSFGTFAPTAGLTWNAKLTQSGAAHSLDMATLNYFDHVSADGRDLADRVNATGYTWNTLGENIAAGYSSVNNVMDGWLTSPGHCANLMRPEFTEIGVACVPGTATSRYNTYWTMNLGRPR